MSYFSSTFLNDEKRNSNESQGELFEYLFEAQNCIMNACSLANSKVTGTTFVETREQLFIDFLENSIISLINFLPPREAIELFQKITAGVEAEIKH